MLLHIETNIIQIHNNVLWDWQYSTEYFHIQVECGGYSAKHCYEYE